ncbi:CBS domain-containing protein [Tropicimonas sp. IMCC34011]|uniref:CBS domain-containing protein n=1 Tax=Tropicimonas sp. IMCC34011 TaxID=2248759 RepID=UPI000E22A99E|nr:CBS domain-containing protein [Tropicimonas sp. IMCC34011]
MLVSQILASKGNGVVTIAPGATVAEAARLLSDKRIGSVVVSADSDHVAGILSERDIVREIGRRGPSCLEDEVEAMMTENIQTCARSDTAESVLLRMSEGRFRHMPVVEEGHMVGMITQGDVVKARLIEVAMEKDALEGMIMGH